MALAKGIAKALGELDAVDVKRFWRSVGGDAKDKTDDIFNYLKQDKNPFVKNINKQWNEFTSVPLSSRAGQTRTASDFVQQRAGAEALNGDVQRGLRRRADKFVDTMSNDYKSSFSRDEIEDAVKGLRGQNGSNWAYNNLQKNNGFRNTSDTINKIFDNRASSAVANKGWLDDGIYNANDSAAGYAKRLHENGLLNDAEHYDIRQKVAAGTYKTSNDVYTDAVAKEKNILKDEYNIQQNNLRKSAAASTPPPAGKTVNSNIRTAPSEEAMRDAGAASAQFESDTVAGEMGATGEKAKRKTTSQDVSNKKAINQWIRKNKTGEFDDFVDYIMGSKAQDSVIKDMYNKNPYIQKAMGEGKTVDDFMKLNGSEQFDMINAGKELRVNDVKAMDQIGFHKVPQMAAGIGTTAWLVSRLDSSKGQMSSSQLYGQQQY